MLNSKNNKMIKDVEDIDVKKCPEAGNINEIGRAHV